jgi:hypothetical protein
VRASAFRMLPRQDFFGGGGGISSVPWCPGNFCQDAFALLNRSEIRSLRWAIDLSREYPGLPAARPAGTSAFSFPGTPSCPLTHTTLTVLPIPRTAQTMFRMLRAVDCPSPAPVWPALAIALVESEYTVMCCQSRPTPGRARDMANIPVNTAFLSKHQIR